MDYSRARIEIVYDILLFIKNEKYGAKPTHILYKANLSPKLLSKYLRVLIGDGLVRRIRIENKYRYKITKKGVIFLNYLREIDKMTHVFNLSK